jgi:hypothetical protein
MVGADWIKSDKREDDLAGRPGGLVQVYSSGASNFPSNGKEQKITINFLAEICSTGRQQIFLHCKYTGGISSALDMYGGFVCLLTYNPDWPAGSWFYHIHLSFVLYDGYPIGEGSPT